MILRFIATIIHNSKIGVKLIFEIFPIFSPDQPPRFALHFSAFAQIRIAAIAMPAPRSTFNGSGNAAIILSQSALSSGITRHIIPFQV